MDSHTHLHKEAVITRPDDSKRYLQSYKHQGYTQVVFKANPTCCTKECRPLNGFVYLIEDLLTFDNPLFRTSHPNCLCKFDTYGQKTVKEPVTRRPVTRKPVTRKPVIKRPIAPESPAPTPVPDKNMWEKTKDLGKKVVETPKALWDKVKNWWGNKKSSQDYKNSIMKEARRIQAAREYKNQIFRRAQWISKK